jgi:hypothetical protein
MFHPSVDQNRLCCPRFAFFYWGGAVRFVSEAEVFLNILSACFGGVRIG